MKRIKVTVLLLCAVCLLASCNKSDLSGYDPKGNTQSNAEGAVSSRPDIVSEAGMESNDAQNQNRVKIMDLDELLNNTKQEDLSCSGYDLKKFTSPFYKSQIVYNEGLFLRNDDKGKLIETGLYFKPLKVLEVRSNDFQTLYVEGSDYNFDSNGNLSIPAGSRIKPMENNVFFPPSADGNEGWKYKKDGKEFFSVNNRTALYAARILVTYARAEEYTGYETMDKSALLTLTEKLNQNKDINLLFLGDSITAGAGLSDSEMVMNYVKLTAEGIQSRTKGKVTTENCAVSGTSSLDHTFLIDGTPEKIHENQKQSAIDGFNKGKAFAKKADVIFIAFGANDGAGWMNGGLTSAQYTANIKKLVDYYRGINPDCSVVLVSSFRPNIYIYTNETTKLVGGDFEQYANALGAIETGKTYENHKNLVYADVFRMQQALLKNKHPEDFLGDNRNHPSDYMTRIYAQTILGTILNNY